MSRTHRIAMCAIAAVMALALAGCAGVGQGANGDSSASQQSDSAPQKNETPGINETTSLDGIIDAITKDFETTQADISAGLESAKAKAGGSYADYTANSDALTSWIDDTQDKTEALIARTSDSAAKYYKLLAQQAPSMDYRDVDDAMKAFYRAVYDDAFSGFYRAVYTDAYKDVYRTFYDGVMKDAYNAVPYAEASDAQSAMYRVISDGQSDLYRTISDAQSDTYRTHSDVASEFYNKNYDLSKVLDE